MTPPLCGLMQLTDNQTGQRSHWQDWSETGQMKLPAEADC